MEYIFIWAPLSFGAMIGWMVVFFIRQYPSFNFIGIIGYKAEKLTACFKYLLDKKITEEDFENYIKSSDISLSEYEDMCQIGDEYLCYPQIL